MKKKPKAIKASNTILGKDSDFEGNMEFFGTITVGGTFKGNISGKGTVIVDRAGDLRCNVYASDVIIYGKVSGHVSAENKICIYSSGKIWGDIEAPDIRIEKGALINGTCNTHKVDKLNNKGEAIFKTDENKIHTL